ARDRAPERSACRAAERPRRGDTGGRARASPPRRDRAEAPRARSRATGGHAVTAGAHVNYALQYLGRSEVREGAGGSLVRLSPNLGRERVFFDAELRDPIRFREAMSALHDVVVGDLRFGKKDRSRYLEWKEQQAREREALEKRLFGQAEQEELA